MLKETFDGLDIQEYAWEEGDSLCFYEADLDVLQKFIDNSQGRNSSLPWDLNPLELGEQQWDNNGRLVRLCVSGSATSGCYTEYTLSGPIPENIGDLEYLRVIVLNNNQLVGKIPASIGMPACCNSACR